MEFKTWLEWKRAGAVWCANCPCEWDSSAKFCPCEFLPSAYEKWQDTDDEEEKTKYALEVKRAWR